MCALTFLSQCLAVWKYIIFGAIADYPQVAQAQNMSICTNLKSENTSKKLRCNPPIKCLQLWSHADPLFYYIDFTPSCQQDAIAYTSSN